jgi:hypothetical protein
MRPHVDIPQWPAISVTNKWNIPVAGSCTGGPPPHDDVLGVVEAPAP